jgi:DNA-binding transcriptional MerR regulator
MPGVDLQHTLAEIDALLADLHERPDAAERRRALESIREQMVAIQTEQRAALEQNAAEVEQDFDFYDNRVVELQRRLEALKAGE